jgi:hypothetical protein
MNSTLSVPRDSEAIAPTPTEPRIFRIFISYASEDLPIAEAIGKYLKIALGDVFAEINLDKWFLRPGSEFKRQIEEKLEKTDVLIIVYSGASKLSHSYTGWEVGFFDHIMRTEPDRTKVAMYLDSPPPISAQEQGIALQIAHEKLQLTTEEFEFGITTTADDPLCSLLEAWQEQVAEITKASGFPKREMKPEQNALCCVKSMRIEIFRYLKTTVDSTLKPQKQITIKARGVALQQSDIDLPPDAELVPVGSGAPMAIFGLSDAPTTWEKFLQTTSASKFRDSWRNAIASVVMSSFPDKINVDNSQVIVSSDEAKAYRIILTTATRYYDDNREFTLYFVEALQRSEFGDQETTCLLKGLELVCRFRFMFLEENSEFSYQNVKMMPPERIPEMVSRMLKELNLLRKDSLDAGLDQPHVWKQFVSWEDIETMAKTYRPREVKIREVIGRIAEAKGDVDKIAPLQQELADILKELEEASRPQNTLLIREMAGKLQIKTGAIEQKPQAA